MIVYKIRPYDMAYDGPVELPDGPTIPKYHTFQAPPEQEGYWPFMARGWVLKRGGKPELPEPDYVGQEAERVRQERNALLKESDWTQGKDIPDSISIPWAQYRDALRNLPEQEDFPYNIEWPQRPE